MMGASQQRRLRASAVVLRIGFIAAISSVSLFLRLVDPTTLSWLAIRPACGAITGLPCIFCGLTRAFHHLFNGHLAEALYFNWLVFPLAIVGGLIIAGFGSELVMQRRLLPALPTFRVTPRLALLSMSAVLALWILQVTLALSLHKHELLNPNGVLYARLIR